MASISFSSNTVTIRGNQETKVFKLTPSQMSKARSLAFDSIKAVWNYVKNL